MPLRPARPRGAPGPSRHGGSGHGPPSEESAPRAAGFCPERFWRGRSVFTGPSMKGPPALHSEIRPAKPRQWSFPLGGLERSHIPGGGLASRDSRRGLRGGRRLRKRRANPMPSSPAARPFPKRRRRTDLPEAPRGTCHRARRRNVEALHRRGPRRTLATLQAVAELEKGLPLTSRPSLNMNPTFQTRAPMLEPTPISDSQPPLASGHPDRPIPSPRALVRRYPRGRPSGNYFSHCVAIGRRKRANRSPSRLVSAQLPLRNYPLPAAGSKTPAPSASFGAGSSAPKIYRDGRTGARARDPGPFCVDRVYPPNPGRKT